MKQKECPSCAMKVDAQSKECPVCGYEFTVMSPWVKWLAVFLAAIFILYQIL